MRIHAHIEVESRDCDGKYEHMWVVVSEDGQDDLAFIQYITGLYANPYAIDSEQRVHSALLGDGDIRMVVTEPTEEGYRSTDITFCHDECDTTERGHRDHMAEAAGY